MHETEKIHPKILGFNIGNTNTALGIYNEEEIRPEKIYIYKTIKNISKKGLNGQVSDTLSVFLKENKKEINIKGAAFSSVVPEIDIIYRLILKEKFRIFPVEINSKINLGIKLKYKNPADLGADRIANAVAAHKEYKKDIIIIDIGTALTFSIILKNGIFDGGLIAPGIGISMEALAERTSNLFKVDFEKPADIIAVSTVEAIKSGYFFSALSVIEGIISRIQKRYKKKFTIILTGGLAGKINQYLECKHLHDPLLIMKGIKYIYDLNIIKQNV